MSPSRWLKGYGGTWLQGRRICGPKGRARIWRTQVDHQEGSRIVPGTRIRGQAIGEQREDDADMRRRHGSDHDDARYRTSPLDC